MCAFSDSQGVYNNCFRIVIVEFLTVWYVFLSLFDWYLFVCLFISVFLVWTWLVLSVPTLFVHWLLLKILHQKKFVSLLRLVIFFSLISLVSLVFTIPVLFYWLCDSKKWIFFLNFSARCCIAASYFLCPK